MNHFESLGFVFFNVWKVNIADSLVLCIWKVQIVPVTFKVIFIVYILTNIIAFGVQIISAELIKSSSNETCQKSITCCIQVLIILSWRQSQYRMPYILSFQSGRICHQPSRPDSPTILHGARDIFFFEGLIKCEFFTRGSVKHLLIALKDIIWHWVKSK